MITVDSDGGCFWMEGGATGLAVFSTVGRAGGAATVGFADATFLAGAFASGDAGRISFVASTAEAVLAAAFGFCTVAFAFCVLISDVAASDILTLAVLATETFALAAFALAGFNVFDGAAGALAAAVFFTTAVRAAAALEAGLAERTDSERVRAVFGVAVFFAAVLAEAARLTFALGAAEAVARLLAREEEAAADFEDARPLAAARAFRVAAVVVVFPRAAPEALAF